MVVRFPIRSADVHRRLCGSLRIQEDYLLLGYHEHHRFRDDGLSPHILGLLRRRTRPGNGYRVLQAWTARIARAKPRQTNSSVGWGIFYWIVNVGAFIAHPLAGVLQVDLGWKAVFLGAAIFTSFNYIMLFTFKDFDSKADKTEGPLHVFVRTIKNIFEPRLLAWLGIMSCFWLMMYQLWDLHPNFLTDWVDSSGVAGILPSFMSHETDRGLQVLQQNMLALNSLLIVVAMIPVSWVVRRLRTLESMVIGMLVATVGI
jgi:POT family proton-dependent oligopeptide transporter